MGKQIKYKAGYKYQIWEDYEHQLSYHFRAKENFETPFLKLDTGALLTVKQGYAYDGPSGPTIDTKNSMRGALVHDCLFQFMRMGLISPDRRKEADKEFKRLLIEDGMSKIRAQIWYIGVRLGARRSSLPENKRQIFTAP